MSHVFSRAPEDAPRIDRAEGVRMWDTAGRSYLDASGGAIVVGIGHGVTEVIEAAADQARRVAYAHAVTFGSEVVEAYADALAEVLPLDDPRVYPVSSGAEAVETALKMARAYHLTRGDDRHLIVGRVGSYHGNTRGALDASGRESLRTPYEPWLGRTLRAPTPYEYRCPFPEDHPDQCVDRHVDTLERMFAENPVAAFIAEPIAGAALGACVPPDTYWPRIAEVCRRHEVLVIADEVMTGFGRTGTWFGVDHWGVRPDILVTGKGAASGYWPLGLAVCSGAVHDTIGRFVHGHTYSHHLVGAATGHAVLSYLRDHDLITASAEHGRTLRENLTKSLADHPHVGDVRGRGLLVGIELVADRATCRPFPRSAKLTERVVGTARDNGLLLYSSTGAADGRDGDVLLLAPPLVATPADLDEIITSVTQAVSTIG